MVSVRVKSHSITGNAFLTVYIRNASLALCFNIQMEDVKLDVVYCGRKCIKRRFLLC